MSLLNTKQTHDVTAPEKLMTLCEAFLQSVKEFY